ncbi:hypothetical protein G7046_g1505 [Stylonectria norvegica]|nr:hypothetical protein G7046_g1505 [Stylonectria norvegica]
MPAHHRPAPSQKPTSHNTTRHGATRHDTKRCAGSTAATAAAAAAGDDSTGRAALVNCRDELANASSGPCVALVESPQPHGPQSPSIPPIPLFSPFVLVSFDAVLTVMLLRIHLSIAIRPRSPAASGVVDEHLLHRPTGHVHGRARRFPHVHPPRNPLSPHLHVETGKPCKRLQDSRQIIRRLPGLFVHRNQACRAMVLKRFY